MTDINVLQVHRYGLFVVGRIDTKPMVLPRQHGGEELFWGGQKLDLITGPFLLSVFTYIVSHRDAKNKTK
jgi:hypothetical protein